MVTARGRYSDKKGQKLNNFFVPRNKIHDEAGEDIVRFRQGDGKVQLLLDYLYSSEGTSRMNIVLDSIFLAPSIIVRSELELLGISSPRFAFRYLIPHGGFLTIRRRNVMKRRIREAFEGREEICKLLSIPIKSQREERNEAKEDSANWIAESMLPIPDRLRNNSNFFITCSSLIEEFGYSSECPLVPFVTHVSFGGGLCAQATCFMALCFLEHEKVIGISEITQQSRGWIPNRSNEKSGASADSLLCVRGMVPNQMVSFFKNLNSPNLDAQLQHYSLDHEGSAKVIAKAIRAYIRNHIPVIQIVSLEKMVGDLADKHRGAVVVPVDAVNHDDYSHIPIGAFERRPTAPRRGIAHSVVIFGCNETSFFINDPGTYPFLQCSDQQLIEIGLVDVESIEELTPAHGSIPMEDQIGQWLQDGSPTDSSSNDEAIPFDEPSILPFISVTRCRLDLPLLLYGVPSIAGDKFNDNYASRTGLFSMVALELTSGDNFGWKIARELEVDEPYPIHGDYYLAQLSTGRDGKFSFKSSHPDWRKLDFNPILQAKDFGNPDWICEGRTFWIHRVGVSRRDQPTESSYDGIFLWDARSRSTNISVCLKGLWIRNSNEWVSQTRIVTN